MFSSQLRRRHSRALALANQVPLDQRVASRDERRSFAATATDVYRAPMPEPAVMSLREAEADSPRRSSPARGRRRVAVRLQAIFWPSYATALMLPWIGVYPIPAMLPNKAAVAISGACMSALVMAACDHVTRRGASRARLLLVALASSVVLGAAWDAGLSIAFGQSVHFDLSSFASIAGGVPRFAGASYHALVLAMWSLMYLTLVHDHRVVPEAATLAPPVTPARIVLHDGRRSVILGATEVDWVEADGDYVRVHMGAKHLMLRATMAATEAALPEDAYVRIHRSAIVRVDHVREVVAKPNDDLLVILRDGTRLRASRRRAARLRAAALDRP